MALFDRYLIVDWSAANAPKMGKDSIWVALCDGTELQWVRNLATRFEAMALVREVIADSLASRKRLFAGFDFAFGYPQGVAERISSSADWQSVWERFSALVSDNADNHSNTYETAGTLNQTAFDGVVDGPFWGHPHQHGERYLGLAPTKPSHAFGMIREFRRVERVYKSAKSLWQMAGAGVVAAQSMTGIKHLQSLREDMALKDHIAVWPFETKFNDDLSKSVVIAEIYPSIFPIEQGDDEVKDAAQVRTVAQVFSQADAQDGFAYCLSCPEDLNGTDRGIVEREEGWIVRAPKVQPAGLDYIRDPAEIYKQSFATVMREANLSSLPSGMREVAVRLIHSCGMIDIVDDIAFSTGAVKAGTAALKNGAPIICDVEMVRHGIIKRHLMHDNELLCAIADEATRTLAGDMQNTRSAAAMDILKDHLGGAVVVIGNAPTALFRLLELIDDGAEKPALIIGMPVGFVGALESKEALIADNRGVPYIAVRGRRGGSAMASATLNALAGGLKGGL